MEITNLNLILNSKQILKDITINFNQNKVIALIGPNGSGKTSLFKCITNLIINYTGSITSNKKTALQLNNEGFFNNFSGYENLTFYNWIKKNPSKNFPYNNKFNFLEKKFRNMSLGMKQILSILEVFQKEADIYLFDEPFNGLDILHREFLKKEILDLKNKNKTIVISSHDISLLEKIVDEVIFIHKGCILFIGTKNDLVAKYGTIENAAINYFYE